MTTMTPEDAIKAAASVARDMADGKLSPSDLERQAVAELRELVGTVVGPDDPAWPLQCDVARQVLALDGIPAAELAEWLGVARQRAGEPLPDETPSPVSQLEPLRADELADAEPKPLPDAEREELAIAGPQPQLRAEAYDPLAGWNAGRCRS